MDSGITLFDELKAEPFTLAMSSGFFGFFAHAGMLDALIESGLSPARVVGSSAGALIGGCYAAGMGTEELCELLFGLSRPDFWDPGVGAGLLKGRKVDKLLREALPVHEMAELRVRFSCSAFRLSAGRTVVLDEGDLPTALRASAAFPGLFHPVRVDGRLHLDGGIGDRPAFAPLKPGERTLYHHLSMRQPWSLLGKRLQAPRRPGVIAVDLGELPKLSPFHLDDGPKAWQIARDRMLRALESPSDSVATGWPR